MSRLCQPYDHGNLKHRSGRHKHKLAEQAVSNGQIAQPHSVRILVAITRPQAFARCEWAPVAQSRWAFLKWSLIRNPDPRSSNCSQEIPFNYSTNSFLLCQDFYDVRINTFPTHILMWAVRLPHLQCRDHARKSVHLESSHKLTTAQPASMLHLSWSIESDDHDVWKLQRISRGDWI